MIARDVDVVSRHQSRVDERSTTNRTRVCDLPTSYVLGVRLSGLVSFSLRCPLHTDHVAFFLLRDLKRQTLRSCGRLFLCRHGAWYRSTSASSSQRFRDTIMVSFARLAGSASLI